MDRVYRNGVCNIAACDGTDSNCSLFSERNLQAGIPIVLRQNFSDGLVTIALMPDWVSLTRDHAPLYRRGWVVQERFLSPRMIHFTRFPVWECSASLVTETFCRDAQPPEMRFPGFPGTQQLDFPQSQRNLFNSSEDDTEVRLWRWLDVVESYTKCGLSQPHDKLIALTGLSNAFSTYIGQDYYAGIWGGEYLIPCLLWTTISLDEDFAPPVPVDYRGMSHSLVARQ